jgi:hypothetical protein
LRVKEAKKQIGKIMKMVNEISRRILIITSIQEGKYTESFLPEYHKRIHLCNSMRRRFLTADPGVIAYRSQSPPARPVAGPPISFQAPEEGSSL